MGAGKVRGEGAPTVRALATEEDRTLAASTMWEAAGEYLAEALGVPASAIGCQLLTQVLALYAALRLDYAITSDDALKAAAQQVARHQRLEHSGKRGGGHRDEPGVPS